MIFNQEKLQKLIKEKGIKTAETYRFDFYPFFIIFLVLTV